MGPTSKYNLMIAPAFHRTQVNICRSLKAYSMHYNRTAIKVWLIAYCCISTSTRYIKFMVGYNTQSFSHTLDSSDSLVILVTKVFTKWWRKSTCKRMPNNSVLFQGHQKEVEKKTHGGRIWHMPSCTAGLQWEAWSQISPNKRITRKKCIKSKTIYSVMRDNISRNLQLNTWSSTYNGKPCQWFPKHGHNCSKQTKN